MNGKEIEARNCMKIDLTSSSRRSNFDRRAFYMLLFKNLFSQRRFCGAKISRCERETAMFAGAIHEIINVLNLYDTIIGFALVEGTQVRLSFSSIKIQC